MTYFSRFPATVYEFNNEKSVVKDIFRRAKFLSEYKPVTDLVQTYTIQDGETPQTVAMKYYGAATYHWVVLMFNEIHNPYFDWPLSQLDLQEYCVQKYSESILYTTRHYEKLGIIVGEYREFTTPELWIPPENPGPLDLNIYPVSFYDYENTLNDSRRVIDIMRPELLGDFVKQFEESING